MWISDGPPRPHYLLHATDYVIERDFEIAKNTCRNAFAFTDDPEQHVLSPDVLVMEACCFLTGYHKNSSEAIGEVVPVHHWRSSPG